jgi:hypothetical protein
MKKEFEKEGLFFYSVIGLSGLAIYSFIFLVFSL